MAPVGIVGIGSYVPPKMSNEDWAKIVDTSDDWISQNWNEEEENRRSVCMTSDLAVEASKVALKIQGLLLRTSTW